jgi:streptogramin lyase
MNEHHDLTTDDGLQALVAETLAVTEPVPAEALATAYAAASLAGLDAELAELVFDSTGDVELVAVRAAEPDVRMLSFANGNLALDVELASDGRTVLGQLDPPGAPMVEIEVDDGSRVPVAVDEEGRFRAEVGEGPLRFRIVGELVTPWITR